jgi:hypothetical protein
MDKDVLITTNWRMRHRPWQVILKLVYVDAMCDFATVLHANNSKESPKPNSPANYTRV